MKKADMQKIEIDLLLEAIFYRYGYDFRDYARASLERRIRRRVDLAGLGSVSEMIPLIMHDPDFFDLFLGDMSITVTSMFRDPYVFKKIRQLVCPKLKLMQELMSGLSDAQRVKRFTPWQSCLRRRGC